MQDCSTHVLCSSNVCLPCWRHLTAPTTPHRHQFYSGKAFYYDGHHPDGATGHQSLSELLFHLMHETMYDLQQLPSDEDEARRAQVGSTGPAGRLCAVLPVWLQGALVLYCLCGCRAP